MNNSIKDERELLVTIAESLDRIEKLLIKQNKKPTVKKQPIKKGK